MVSFLKRYTKTRRRAGSLFFHLGGRAAYIHGVLGLHVWPALSSGSSIEAHLALSHINESCVEPYITELYQRIKS